MGYIRKNFKLSELIFFITYKCNFRCKTCFYGNELDQGVTNTGKEMSIDEIRKVSFSLGKFDKLLISGGEPFLRDEIAEICEIFYLQNKINSIHLPTNGFYVEKISNNTRSILKKCPKIDLTIGLPLDGLKETHDKIKGVKGSYEKVLETAKSLANLKREFNNLSTYIITVVNNVNLSEIITLSEFIKTKLPVDGHGPSPMHGEPYDTNLLPPSYKEWRELSKKLIKYRTYWNRKRANTTLKAFRFANMALYLDDIYTLILKGEKMPFKCQAGNIIGVLEPNGDVKLCELTDVIGNVRSVEYDFKKIWFSNRAEDTREMIKDCTCTHACFLLPSIKKNLLSLVKSCFLGRL